MDWIIYIGTGAIVVLVFVMGIRAWLRKPDPSEPKSGEIDVRRNQQQRERDWRDKYLPTRDRDDE